MPIYEYWCPQCRKKADVLVRNAAPASFPHCPRCESAEMVRLVSRFAVHKSMKMVWEESGEPGEYNAADYYKDPRNIGRWAENKFKEMGMEMPGELQNEISAAREGVMPESLKDLESASPDATYH